MTKIGIIGGGNMGAAILAGIDKQYTVAVCEQDKKRAGFLKRRFRVATCGLEAILNDSKVIILAVKPQSFDSVLKQVRPFIREDQIVISIAAGITTKYIEKRLGKGIRVVRTMPNLPAQIQKGVTGICAGKFAKKVDLTLAKDIFNHIGGTIIVEEKWMDAVTAVSGSGPAYMFLFMECFLKSAKALGLKDDVSLTLVKQTIEGSLELVHQQKECPSVLRQRVTSKGGTTQAALSVFEKKRFEATFKEALKAARKRAKELSQ